MATLDPPIVSLTSAPSGSGTLTFSFSSDAGFPLATTTFFVLDPGTGAVLFEFPGLVPPTAVLAGLSETDTYDIVAISFNSASSEFSAPSLAVRVEPLTWSGLVLKNVIHFNPKYGAREYELLDEGGTVIQTSLYPVFVDAQVFASEESAQIFIYSGRAVIDENPMGVIEIRRYRTGKTLCLVTGEVLEINAEPQTGQPTPVQFRLHRLRVPDTNRPRRRREVQRAYQTDFQVEAWPNYLGQWGAFLVSGSVVWAEIGDRRIEFAVPFAATAELVDISQIERSILPKRT